MTHLATQLQHYSAKQSQFSQPQNQRKLLPKKALQPKSPQPASKKQTQNKPKLVAA